MKTIENVSNYAHETIDKIANASTHAAQEIDEKGEELKNAEQELINSCKTYIRDNPVYSLGIAVATGFLLSRLLSSR